MAIVTQLFRDDFFLRHRTGAHVEVPARLEAIHAKLDQSGLAARCEAGVYQPLSDDALLAVHDRDVVERIRVLIRAGGGRLDPDTVVSDRSLAVAKATAGACCAAVDAVLAGSAGNALCLVRPPGHHATPHRSMGFCLVNNVALAVRHAQRHGVGRVLVVDWDVHHGNGTQDVFYNDGSVQFLSVHRYGGGFYPGTGAADETGTGAGLGATVNVPLRAGVSRADYVAHFRRALESSAERIRPELVILSAGFDAHRRDPIGSLGLETEDFATLTEEVVAVAKSHCAGKLVSCLEGGYDQQALADSVAAHLERLLAAGA